MTHLEELEAESIFILRETAAQFDKPVLLFSGGKDSIVMTYLTKKAFWPAAIPFPLLHIDTGHNFEETLTFRDNLANQLNAELIVRYVQTSIDEGKATEETGPNASRNALQTITLLDALSEFQFDAALGGARRDEEKARAKERFFSHRNAFGQWDPKNQRAELWNIFNAEKKFGEHFRVFPLSNWTELDIWNYIKEKNIPLPNLYFSHDRPVFERGGSLLAASEFLPLQPNEVISTKHVRFRTIGDITCTGEVESIATSIDEIIAEIATSDVTERGTRSDEARSETAMEDRKKQGYF
jgi:sulfate adenylyltransferase subunit 2